MDKVNRKFWVTATHDIDADIKSGDCILIDPDQAPAAGKRVLIDGRLETWNGQAANIAGAAVQINRRYDGTVVGRFSPEPESSNA